MKNISLLVICMFIALFLLPSGLAGWDELLSIEGTFIIAEWDDENSGSEGVDNNGGGENKIINEIISTDDADGSDITDSDNLISNGDKGIDEPSEQNDLPEYTEEIENGNDDEDEERIGEECDEERRKRMGIDDGTGSEDETEKDNDEANNDK